MVGSGGREGMSGKLGGVEECHLDFIKVRQIHFAIYP